MGGDTPLGSSSPQRELRAEHRSTAELSAENLATFNEQQKTRDDRVKLTQQKDREPSTDTVDSSQPRGSTPTSTAVPSMPSSPDPTTRKRPQAARSSDEVRALSHNQEGKRERGGSKEEGNPPRSDGNMRRPVSESGTRSAEEVGSVPRKSPPKKRLTDPNLVVKRTNSDQGNNRTGGRVKRSNSGGDSDSSGSNTRIDRTNSGGRIQRSHSDQERRSSPVPAPPTESPTDGRRARGKRSGGSSPMARRHSPNRGGLHNDLIEPPIDNSLIRVPAHKRPSGASTYSSVPSSTTYERSVTPSRSVADDSGEQIQQQPNVDLSFLKNDLNMETEVDPTLLIESPDQTLGSISMFCRSSDRPL